MTAPKLFVTAAPGSGKSTCMAQTADLLRFESDGGFVFVTALRSMRVPDPDANLTFGS